MCENGTTSRNVPRARAAALTSTAYVPPGCGSRRACDPIQRAYSSVSVKNAKTISGDAAIVVSQTIVSISLTATMRSLAVLLLLGSVLQLGQTLVPEVMQECTQLGQTFWTSAIQTARTGAALLDQAGLAQDAQML